MRNLLSAGLVRLARCKALWITGLLLVGNTLVDMLSLWWEGVEYGQFSRIDTGFFGFTPLLAIFAAVVCGLFLGGEQADGPLRNKLVVGHSKTAVYLSHLILCGAASLILCACAVIPGLALGLPLLGGFRMGAVRAVLYILGICALSLALAAIFTLVGMLVSSRAVSVTAAILLAWALLLAGVYVETRLNAAPTVPGVYVVTDGSGGTIVEEAEESPNPDYLPEGPVRDVFQLLDDFCPGSQVIRYASLEAARPEVLMLWDGVIVLAATGAGLALFRRKDLK